MDSTKERLKTIIIESLHLEGITPDKIGDDAQLFGGAVGWALLGPGDPCN